MIRRAQKAVKQDSVSHECPSAYPCVTRRDFIRTAAAAASCLAVCRAGVAAGAGSSALPTDARPFAACGLYCGACESYLRGVGAPPSQAECLGCWSLRKPPSYGPNCQVRACCRGRKIRTCGECPDFPCPTIRKFFAGGARYELREKYLLEIRKSGLETWLAGQRKRWTCASCGTAFAYGDHRCGKCGKPVLTAEQELEDFKKAKSSGAASGSGKGTQ